MFPIRDHNPSDRTPYVTNGLIFLNILIFLLTAAWAGGAENLFYEGALYSGAVTSGHLYYGLLTHMFLHAGIMHLGGNMLFLWIFGDNLEDQMGHVGFLAFYLACGLGAAGAQIYADPDSTIPMVGASGAIAGVMGGYLLLFPLAKVDIVAIIVIIIKRFTLSAWIVLMAWFGLQLFSGYASEAGGGGVAYWAHAGGFVVGVVLTLPLFLRLGGAQFWTRTHGHPPYAPVDYHLSRVPQVRR